MRWIPEQDYLIVLCENGSLSIWEISSGELESTLFGPSIPQILQSSQTLDPIMENMIEVSPEAGPLYVRSLTIRKTGPTPVQSFLLDVKNILTQSKIEELITLFTYFLPWGIIPTLDEQFKSVFKLDLPSPMPSFSIKGKGGTLSLSTPFARGLTVWQSSHYLTALHTLAGVSIAKKIMATSSESSIQNLCSQLLHFYCTVLPEKLKGYSSYISFSFFGKLIFLNMYFNFVQFFRPSLHFLVEFWRDPDEDVMQASRSIFVATTNRMSQEDRKKYIQSWAQTLKDRSESQNLAILVLAILACHFPDSMDKGFGVCFVYLHSISKKKYLQIDQSNHKCSGETLIR